MASWTMVMAVRAGQILDEHVESEADSICLEEVRAKEWSQVTVHVLGVNHGEGYNSAIR